jgi:hypothetical protein
MEDIVYRYSGSESSQTKCIDIAQASTDPQTPYVSIAIGDRFVVLDRLTAQQLSKRIADLATPLEPKPY